MRTALSSSLLILCLIHAAWIGAAPLPPFTPVDVTGTIAEVRWVPAQHIKGIPGMSGSAGHDRTFPGHYIIKLTDYSGVNAATAREMTRYIDWHALQDLPLETMPPFIILQINHQDPQMLKPSMTITVRGYDIRGDEGGTWTSQEALIIEGH